jgi:hypothetical protein
MAATILRGLMNARTLCTSLFITREVADEARPSPDGVCCFVLQRSLG